jgi:hypothetical protein
LGTYRGPVWSAGGRKHIGAAEQFYLQFAPAGTERVKLSNEVTDTEVHIAMPFGILGTGRPG